MYYIPRGAGGNFEKHSKNVFPKRKKPIPTGVCKEGRHIYQYGKKFRDLNVEKVFENGTSPPPPPGKLTICQNFRFAPSLEKILQTPMGGSNELKLCDILKFNGVTGFPRWQGGHVPPWKKIYLILM